MISVCIVAYNRDDMLAKTWPTWKRAQCETREPVEWVIAADRFSVPEDLPAMVWVACSLPFSAGAWRTLAAQRSTGDVLVMLDADMAAPVNYLYTMADIVHQGMAAFPLYMRERSPGGPASPGNGWGNAAFSRAVWERACQTTHGEPYPTGTRWGGEDVAFAKLVTQTLRVPLWRRLVPGLVHLWHPKTGSPWYDGATEPCVDGPDRV